MCIIDPLRYEFQLDSTLRSQSYRFRAETQEQLDMWVTGLNTLKQPSS